MVLNFKLILNSRNRYILLMNIEYYIAQGCINTFQRNNKTTPPCQI